MAQHIDTGSGILEAQYTSYGPASGRKWFTCQICGLDYPEDEVSMQGGAAFCHENGCYKDMNTRR